MLGVGNVSIRDFSYDDKAPWPTAADGSGPCLVLINPGSNPDHSMAANWRTSYEVGGTPGADDALLYGNWASSMNLVDSLTGSDPDGDGITNLLEYALNGNPNAPPGDELVLPVPMVGGDGHLWLTFNRYLNRSDLTLIVQASDSLTGAWTDLAQSVNGANFAVMTLGTTISDSGDYFTRSMGVGDIYPLNDPAHRHRFMRLKVTKP